MKYFFLMIFILLACNRYQHNNIEYMIVSVLQDVTDPHILKPEANDLLSLYDLSNHKDAGVTFRYRQISDKILSSVTCISLRDKSQSNASKQNINLLRRERLIVNFYDSIRKIVSLNNRFSDTSVLEYSECFRTITQELKSLTEKGSQKKVLVIYSNLFERSNVYSFYDERIRNILVRHPEEIKACFEKLNLLPHNLSGIIVFLAFKPANREEDSLYLAIAQIYRELLESRGALVKIQADNNFQSL